MNITPDIIAYIESNEEKFYRIAFSYVKKTEDALDVVHDTIVKALQKRHTLRKPEYMQTWFYRILINESLTFLRKNKIKISFEDLDDSQIPSTKDLSQTDYMDLYHALDRLPLNLKTIVLLRFFEDMKIEEIARVTSLNLSTTKSRLYKALQILKIDMEVGEYEE